ncbi:hypothetical protein AAFF_G00013300 [Aldrovandia affinis]|uniref:Reverse transcriptase domain-containing protein n=1 Tax=Aldrovandia affinis TaxID=143900 RepID=A0AAD7R390_9TELE|nr:hypothetical protein AAFF_G00013300 [Aldrovandia affinis]
MTQNSKKAWSTIRKLNGDKITPPSVSDITPNQVGSQLVANGRRAETRRAKGEHHSTVIPGNQQNMSILTKPFTSEEFEAGLNTMKLGKAAGPDDILMEMITHLGPVAKQWFLNMYNTCLLTQRIPSIWRKAIITALLKPGKDPNLSKSYRPISLLCTTYKLFERLLLSRLSPQIDAELIKDQAGFRPGKSCTGQLLNLTQHIEDGYQKKLITGTAFVDLTVITKAERTKQAIDNRHLLHEHSAVRKRLGSRSSFLDTSEALETTPTDARTTEWQKQWNSLGSQAAQWKERGITPDECLATGHDQPWAVWKTLNRLRVGEGRCKASMKKWNITTSDACACGEPQTMEHLMNCTQAPQCTGDDLAEPTAAALACANHWKDEI